ncbi:hypothetical protein JW992_14420 [candidate division KSB1 bacterium]|nr:hypothetical protein [candidate division KSB1 bacterium]
MAAAGIAVSAQAETLQLSWQAVTQDTLGQSESAPLYYAIHIDTLPTFSPSPENLLAATTATSYTLPTQTGKNYFVVIRVYDSWGNASDYSEKAGSVPWVVGEVRLQLEGAYDAAGDSMRTILRQRDLLPLHSPYSAAARETETVPESTVDWIEVQLRDAEDPAVIRSRKSFFLDQNGYARELDGTTQLGLTGVGPGSYYIAVSHRNHLAVMSAQPQLLQTEASEAYDFSDDGARFYQNGGLELEPGVWGSISSDANHNGQVQNNDKNDYWRTQVGLSGYREADFNLNGEVQNNDKNDYWRRHVGRGTQVP